MKKEYIYVFTPSQSTMKYGSENRIYMSGLEKYLVHTKCDTDFFLFFLVKGLMCIMSFFLYKMYSLSSFPLLFVSLHV